MSRPFLNVDAFRSHTRRRTRYLLDTYRDPSWRSARYRSLVLGNIILELDNLIVHTLNAYALTTIWQLQRSRLIPKHNGRYMTADEFRAQKLRVLKPTRYAKLHSPVHVSRDEDWAIRDPKEISTLLAGVCGQPPTDLTNAIALNGRVFYETKIVRHFYAHRCEDTILKLKIAVPAFGAGLIGHPDQYVDAILPGRSETNFVRWWSEFDDFLSVL